MVLFGAEDVDGWAGRVARPGFDLCEGVLFPLVGDVAEGFEEVVDEVVVVPGGGAAGEGEAGGDAQDGFAGGVEVVGQAEEGVDARDVALGQDVAHGGDADAGVGGDDVGLDVALLELAAEPG